MRSSGEDGLQELQEFRSCRLREHFNLSDGFPKIQFRTS